MRAHLSKPFPAVLITFFCALTLAVISAASPHRANSAASQQPIAPPALDKSKIVVYVSDFELQAAPRFLPSSAPANSSSAQRPQNANANPSASPNSPQQQARILIDLLSANIVVSLQQQGYQPTRLSSARPSSGVLLRGVFAESDELNHIRRALLGSGSPSPRFLVIVAAQNLAKPEQAFYQIVDPKTPGISPDETRFGPVITVTSYAPAAKYDLSKEPTLDDIKRLASQIAAGLSALIQANPAALTPSP